MGVQILSLRLDGGEFVSVTLRSQNSPAIMMEYSFAWLNHGVSVATPLNRIVIFVGDVEKCAAALSGCTWLCSLYRAMNRLRNGLNWIPAAVGLRFIRPVVEVSDQSPTGGPNNPHKIVFQADDVSRGASQTGVAGCCDVKGPSTDRWRYVTAMIRKGMYFNYRIELEDPHILGVRCEGAPLSQEPRVSQFSLIDAYAASPIRTAGPAAPGSMPFHFAGAAVCTLNGQIHGQS